MYCYLLEFPVKPGREEEFISTWAALTEHIRRHAGGLGSRLHKTPDGKFIAYAQWPNAHERNRERAQDEEGERLGKAMRATLEAGPVRILYELEVTRDLLVAQSEP